ncbi:MAG: phenylalanine 4-monooxygenase [Actinomycetales bacterium]|nr:phenylalanine 4-monooxygenase [Actinomycetales bacterium]
MFTDGQLYAPVVTLDGGEVVVELGHDHPGVGDPAYRERRNTIAALALGWTEGRPVPVAEYTEEEHDVWRVVSRELERKHERLACRAARDGRARLRLPDDHIPQLTDVTAALAPLSGFTYLPAAGLVPLREFYGSLADRRFWSTQYIRHHSVPLYTPEPDVVHEVIGHAVTLAEPSYAELYVAAGRAARRVESAEALEFVSKVFWFSLEFGVVHEPDGPKAYGAGLLSSYGEIEEFVEADLRPLDLARMGVQTYDITHYQPILFAARSWSEVVDVVGGFFDTATDESIGRLLRDSDVSA